MTCLCFVKELIKFHFNSHKQYTDSRHSISNSLSNHLLSKWITIMTFGGNEEEY